MSSPARNRFMLGNESIRNDGECFVLAPARVEVKKESSGLVRGSPLGVRSNSPSEGEHKHSVR